MPGYIVSSHKSLMPSSHFACDQSTVPVAPLSCGLHAEAGGDRVISVQINGCRSLYDFVK